MSNPLSRFLGHGETLSRLHDHARRLQQLQTQLERALPGPLGRACAVANLKGETLVIIAQSGSVAARLRQMAPSLTRAMGTTGGPLISGIQVKVALTTEPEPRPQPPSRTIGNNGRDSLATLIEQLPEGDELRRSLERLLERCQPEPE